MNNPDPRDLEAVLSVREQLRLAEETCDASVIEDLYTEDVVVMPPNVPTLEGRQAFVEFARRVLAELSLEFQRRVQVTGVEVTIVDDVAFEWGSIAQTLIPRAGGEQIQETIRYASMYRRCADGQWRVRRLIFNLEHTSEHEARDAAGIVDPTVGPRAE
jgi:uncharacterized protein (TIGR02246 family)